MPRFRLIETPLSEPLSQIFAAPPGEDVKLWWLGQAGFVIDGGGRRVVIDPYLSDSLAGKYEGKRFSHERLMPVPVAPDQIAHVDLVVATHAHTDHLDPGTLPDLMARNPSAKLLAPAAERDKALERAGVGADRLIAVDAGEVVEPFDGLTLHVTRAAHEDVQRDEKGRHLFLGVALRISGGCIFHSGDTVPFDGQEDEVRALNADLALFPVNGRDALRADNGIAGNFHLDEAVALAKATAIPAMIAHHFDMFAFNTIRRKAVELLALSEQSVDLRPARTGVAWQLVRDE